MHSFVIKGDICWSAARDRFCTESNAYLVCLNGISGGVFRSLPEEYARLPLLDYTGKLVIPGMADLHIHAPQYAFRGLGMDLELMDWLEAYTFPEEAKYADVAYAKKAYTYFANNLKRSATTRAVIFATVHPETTVLLMDLLEASGLVSYVGKVNMDHIGPPKLREKSPEASLRATRDWLNQIQGRYQNTMPILTPRFLPACSRELLAGLQGLRREYDLPVQSHLSENPGEVELVRRLFPESRFYGETYNRYGFFGTEAKTIMAHCVYTGPEELALMKQNGVFVAHSPASNMNLSSGIAPIRTYLNQNIPMGLATDVAGGESESMFRAISDSVQVSKLYWRLVDKTAAPIKFEEAFYLATAGGGAFFGKVGSFAPGYELDALVIDDASLREVKDLTVSQRLQRAVYLEADRDSILAKFVRGAKIL